MSSFCTIDYETYFPVQCFDTWKVTDDVQVSWLISSDVNQNATFRIELPAGDVRWAPGRWIGIGISDNTNMVGCFHPLSIIQVDKICIIKSKF